MKRIVSFNDCSAYPEAIPRRSRTRDQLNVVLLDDSSGQEDDADRHPSNRFSTRRLAIVMCGLPGVGKTASAHSLKRYLNWIGFSCAIFNVGEKRREKLGASQPANFFDPDNPEGARLRWRMARETLDDMVSHSMSGPVQPSPGTRGRTTRYSRHSPRFHFFLSHLVVLLFLPLRLNTLRKMKICPSPKRNRNSLEKVVLTTGRSRSMMQPM